LYLHPKIAKAAVVGVKNKRGEEIPKAYIQPKPGEKPTSEEVLTYLKERLTPPLIPGEIAIRENLPLTPPGKMDKKILR